MINERDHISLAIDQFSGSRSPIIASDLRVNAPGSSQDRRNVPDWAKSGVSLHIDHWGQLITDITSETDRQVDVELENTSSYLRTVAVFGGAGYVGSLLVRRLLRAGYQIRVFDAFLHGENSLKDLENDPRLEIIRADAAHISRVTQVLDGVDAVVHLAEYDGNHADEKVGGNLNKTNYLTTAAIAHTCSFLGLRRFIYGSTTDIYCLQSNAGDGSCETDNPIPSSWIKAKRQSESSILSHRSARFAPVVLRFGRLYGLSSRPRFDVLVNALTAQALFNDVIATTGSSLWRPYTHVSDAALALHLALEAPAIRLRQPVYNVVGENQPLQAVIETIRMLIPNTRLETLGEIGHRVSYRAAGDAAKYDLGFVPRLTLREGVIEIIEALVSGRIRDYRDRRYYNRSRDSIII